jgi:hypothetical protein
VTRHCLRTVCDGRPWLVVIGYDRPLNQYFLQLWDGAADQPAYSSLEEPAADWRDIATVLQRLRERGIEVPCSMTDAVTADCAMPAGNRIVEHSPSGEMTISPG